MRARCGVGLARYRRGTMSTSSGPMSTGSGPLGDWKPEELELRKQEVGAAASNAKTQQATKNIQLFTGILSSIAVAVAVFAAYEGFQALKITSANNVEQANQNQMSTAINALGSSDPAERIAGLVLLRRNASGQISPPPLTAADRQGAYDTYATALDVFGSYIHNYSLSFINAHSGQSFGLGYGSPPSLGTPLDVTYAADEIGILLTQGNAVKALGTGQDPSLDLANDELSGQSWPRVDFSWLSGRYFVGIDLRGATLEHSDWGAKASLQGAHFQCADLEYANFHGAYLEKADFRGADVNGADFTGAKLAGAQASSLFGKARGLRPGMSVKKWNGPDKASCLAAYADNAPTPSPSPSQSTASQR